MRTRDAAVAGLACCTLLLAAAAPSTGLRERVLNLYKEHEAASAQPDSWPAVRLELKRCQDQADARDQFGFCRDAQKAVDACRAAAQDWEVRRVGAIAAARMEDPQVGLLDTPGVSNLRGVGPQRDAAQMWNDTIASLVRMRLPPCPSTLPGPLEVGGMTPAQATAHWKKLEDDRVDAANAAVAAFQRRQASGSGAGAGAGATSVLASSAASANAAQAAQAAADARAKLAAQQAAAKQAQDAADAAALDDRMDKMNAAQLMALADDLTDQGRPDQARRALRALVDKFPTSPLANQAASQLAALRNNGAGAGASQAQAQNQGQGQAQAQAQPQTQASTAAGGSGGGNPVAVCKASVDGSSLARRINGPWSDDIERMRGVIAFLDFAIGEYGGCSSDPAAVAYIQRMQTARQQTLDACRATSADGGRMCLVSPF